MGIRTQKKYYLLHLDENYKTPIVNKKHKIIFLRRNVRSLTNGKLEVCKRDLYPGYVLLCASGNIGAVKGARFVSRSPLEVADVLDLIDQCNADLTEIVCEFEIGNRVHVMDNAKCLYAGMTGVYLGVDFECDFSALVLVEYIDENTIVNVPLDFLVAC